MLSSLLLELTLLAPLLLLRLASTTSPTTGMCEMAPNCYTHPALTSTTAASSGLLSAHAARTSLEPHTAPWGKVGAVRSRAARPSASRTAPVSTASPARTLCALAASTPRDLATRPPFRGLWAAALLTRRPAARLLPACSRKGLPLRAEVLYSTPKPQRLHHAAPAESPTTGAPALAASTVSDLTLEPI